MTGLWLETTATLASTVEFGLSTHHHMEVCGGLLLVAHPKASSPVEHHGSLPCRFPMPPAPGVFVSE